MNQARRVTELDDKGMVVVREDVLQPGRLLLLAGPSSAGKTTLGLALIEALGDWMFWEVDRAGPKMPKAMQILPEQVPHFSENELAAALDKQARLTEASVTAVAAYVRAGFNLIAEIDLWSDEDLAIASRVWEGVDPLVVELQCPIDVLEDRERKRGSVYVGTARAQAERDNWVGPRGLVLDATEPTEDGTGRGDPARAHTRRARSPATDSGSHGSLRSQRSQQSSVLKGLKAALEGIADPSVEIAYLHVRISDGSEIALRRLQTGGTFRFPWSIA